MRPVARSIIRNAVSRAISDPGVGGGAAGTPLELFRSGEQGLWFLPADFSTMFQDAAGAAPVTAVEQPVGRILDKSGRGNHATQADAAKKPKLSARKNLLVGTESLTSGWSLVRCARAGDLYTVDANGYAYATQTAVTASKTVSAKLKAGTAGIVTIATNGGSGEDIAYFNLTTGTVGAKGNNNASSAMEDLGGGEYRCSVTRGPTAGSAVYIGLAYGVIGDTFYMSQAQLEAGPTATRYQRVNTVTNYDTVGFPYYLKFDVVDDSLRSTFPNLGSNVTIGRSIPGTGASILTGQTIGAGNWDDSTSHCALVIIDRALTGPETALVTDYLNARAGL